MGATRSAEVVELLGRVPAFATLEHRFNEDWSVSADAMMLGQAINEKFASVQGAAEITNYQAFITSSLNQHAYGLSAKVLGTFSAFGFEQSVAAGVSYSRTAYSLSQNLGIARNTVTLTYQ